MKPREETIRAFLKEAGWEKAERRALAGDASSRRYERLSLDDRPAVLMDWPSGPDAPVIEGRAAYSRIAHLAEPTSKAKAGEPARLAHHTCRQGEQS